MPHHRRVGTGSERSSTATLSPASVMGPADAGTLGTGGLIALCGPDIIPASIPPMTLRAVSCDDCTLKNFRYVGDTAFERAKDHAQRLHHRTRVAEDGKKDVVYDYRPRSSSPTED